MARYHFFCGVPCPFEIVANCQCEIYQFSREFVINELIPNNPRVAINIIKTLSYKTSVLAMQVHETALFTPYKRVCRLFYVIGHLYGIPHNEGLLIKKHLSHQEIANITGVHRVTVTKILNYLSKKGAIKTSRRSLLISNPDYLAKVISEPDPVL